MYTGTVKTKSKQYLSRDGKSIEVYDESDLVKDDGSVVNYDYVINICDEKCNVIAREFGYDSYPSNEQIRFTILKHNGKHAFVNRLFNLEY